MISVGVDIGSTTTKAAIVGDDGLIAGSIIPTGNLPGKTAEEVFQKVLAEASLKESEIDIIATTGYGRRLADFGDLVMTEIKACAAGTLASSDSGERIHTVIDVGGQDTKVIAMDDDGEIEDFSMNDKCAAGTGRFLEVLAAKLGMPYEAFVEEALKSDTMLQMNATCAVFAESEVVGLLARNVPKCDIALAAHNAIASRIASMTRRVGSRGAYCFVGGGARNKALVQTVSEHLNKPIHVPERAQLIVAWGAAVGARAKAKRVMERGNE